MRAPPAEWARRLRAGLLPATLVVLTPKCLACLAAYAGLGATLGLAGPELCGGTVDVPGLAAPLLFLATGSAWLWFRRAR